MVPIEHRGGELGMKVGSLVKFSRFDATHPDSLPIGMIVEINHEASSTGEGAWCSMLWDDGSISGAWLNELVKVECK